MSYLNDGESPPDPTTVHRVPWANRYDLARKMTGNESTGNRIAMPAKHPDKSELLCYAIQINGEGGKQNDQGAFEFETAVITAKYRYPLNFAVCTTNQLVDFRLGF